MTSKFSSPYSEGKYATSTGSVASATWSSEGSDPAKRKNAVVFEISPVDIHPATKSFSSAQQPSRLKRFFSRKARGGKPLDQATVANSGSEPTDEPPTYFASEMSKYEKQVDEVGAKLRSMPRIKLPDTVPEESTASAVVTGIFDTFGTHW